MPLLHVVAEIPDTVRAAATVLVQPLDEIGKRRGAVQNGVIHHRTEGGREETQPTPNGTDLRMRSKKPC